MLGDLLPADLVPFAGIPAWGIALVFASHFLGCFIRGTFGFGSNMAIVLMTTWVLGPHHAIVLALLSTLAAQGHLFPQGLKTADWPVAKPLIVGLITGIALGTWVFAVLATEWLTLVLGLLVITVIAMDHLKLLERLARITDIRSKPVTSTLALIAGVVGAVAGGGAFYFLVIYLKMACSTPAGLRGTNLVLSACSMVARVTFIAIAGFFTAPILVEGALLVPVVYLGTWAGTRYFHSSSADRFFLGLQVLLLSAATGLVTKGIFKVL